MSLPLASAAAVSRGHRQTLEGCLQIVCCTYYYPVRSWKCPKLHALQPSAWNQRLEPTRLRSRRGALLGRFRAILGASQALLGRSLEHLRKPIFSRSRPEQAPRWGRWRRWRAGSRVEWRAGRGEPLQPQLVRTPRPYKRAHVHNWQTLIDSANYLRTHVRECDNAHVTTFVRRTYLRAHARTYT